MSASKKTGKDRRYIKRPGVAEDAKITEAARSDPDTWLLSDREWAEIKPTARRGRPPAAVKKERITIRLSPEVLDAFRATGPGWQTRMDAALKQWLEIHNDGVQGGQQ